jgi:hypothetical protein
MWYSNSYVSPGNVMVCNDESPLIKTDQESKDLSLDNGHQTPKTNLKYQFLYILKNKISQRVTLCGQQINIYFGIECRVA